jgi:hypothetical protein
MTWTPLVAQLGVIVKRFVQSYKNLDLGIYTVSAKQSLQQCAQIRPFSRDYTWRKSVFTLRLYNEINSSCIVYSLFRRRIGDVTMSSFKDVKRQQLQNDHSIKLKQFEEVATALRVNLNPGDKPKLEAQLERLEKEITSLEQQLLDLGQAPAPTAPSGGTSTPSSGQNITTGNVNGGNVNIGGTQNIHGNVTITYNYGHMIQTLQQGSGEPSDKAKLEALMTELKTALEQIPTDQKSAAERVVKRTEELITEVSAPEVEKEAVESKASLLKRAAENISEALPVVLGISTRIIAYALQMAGVGH